MNFCTRRPTAHESNRQRGSTRRKRPLPWLLLVAAYLCLPQNSSATTWHIRPDGSGDSPTIKSGVAAAAAGDTVLVEFGTYYEDSILVDKSIVVTGPPTDWPSIRGRLLRGAWIGVIFKVFPPANPTFRNMILRDADVGVLARNDSNDCAGPGASMTASNLVLLNLRVAGIDDDNFSCKQGTATITNCTAINCGFGFQINDYGSVTASNLVALACTNGINAIAYSAASFRRLVFWLNGSDAVGVVPQDTVVADPLLCDIFHDNFGVGPASPCLPSNNLWGVLIGAGAQNCTTVTGVEDETLQSPSKVVVAGSNPTGGAAAISFGVPHAMRVEVAVFSVDGKRIRSLLHEVVGPGRHQIQWDGRDEHGQAARSGVYFARVAEERSSRTCRIVLVR